MTMTERDLFRALRVSSAIENTATSNTNTRASRIDIGWAAWRACPKPAKASLLKRWAFHFQLWRHFGRAIFLVQVDNSYHTATSVRIRQQPEQDNIDILLMQSVSFWQCLRGRWQHRLNKPAPIWRKHLVGQEVIISRYPRELGSAALPRVTHLGYKACAEVLLDGQHASQLPLRISSSR